ncbi:MAG: PIN domain-containing protein [Thaumarchaeota archaeon]|nr:PIN domain-containing protein [Nitrososphaerota archaeon]
MLADTAFLIDVMKADEKALAKAKELEADSIPVLVGAPTIFELYVGVGLSVRSSEEKERVLEVLRSLTHLPLDQQSATRAGLVYAHRSREGVEMDPEDAMIAGIALENHETLLTRNRRHFSGIPELKLEGY